jgi:predicted heme/steroid binding protein
MKNTKLISILGLAIIIIMFVTVNNIASNNSEPSNEKSKQILSTKSFDESSLSTKDGKGKNPCYIAVENKVFDASKIISQIKMMPKSNGTPNIECGKKIDIQKNANMPKISEILTEVGEYK